MSQDSTPISVLYSDEELRQIILTIIESCGATGVTVSDICSRIVQTAIQEHMVKNADENVIITAEELAFEEQLRVYGVLGELTKENEISILSKQNGSGNGENRFVSNTKIPAEPSVGDNIENSIVSFNGDNSEMPTEFTVAGINYQVLSFNDRTVEVSQNMNASGDIVIPDKVTFNNLIFRVVGIGERVFANNGQVRSVSLPDTITSVGFCAFNKLDIQMSLPLSLEMIGGSAFAFNRFDELRLPSGVKEIGSLAFAYTSIESGKAIIPSSVNVIEGDSFYSSEIKEFIVDDNNSNYKSVAGVLFSKDGKKLIAYPRLKEDVSYTIPTGVTTIGSYAFVEIDCLTKLVVPETVNTLEESALESCPGLKTIVMNGKTPPTLEDAALDGVEDSCIIFVPKGCTNKYKGAAGWKEKAKCIVEIPTEFTEAKITYKVLSLDDMTVEVAKMQNVSGAISIPSQVTNNKLTFNVVGIAANAFDGVKKDSSVKLPATIREIGDGVFKNAKFSISVDPDNPNYCAENNVLYDKEKTKLIQYMASKPKCEEFSVPEGVKTIGRAALQEANIEHLHLPASLKSIESVPFLNNTNITKITVDAETPPSVEDNLFSGMSDRLIVFVPKGCVEEYKAAPGWKQVVNIVDEMPKSFTTDDICYNVISFEEKTVEVVESPNASGAVTIPAKVTYSGLTFNVIGIGESAFCVDNEITDVSLPDTIKNIGDTAFSLNLDNVSLKNAIVLPKSLESVGQSAFSRHFTFVNLDLPSSMKVIDNWAFGCQVRTKKAVIPASVSYIGSAVFRGSNVEKIVVDSANPKYQSSPEGALFTKNKKNNKNNKETLIELPPAYPGTSCKVPNDVKVIGSYAFSNCKNLREIILPETVNSIGQYAFTGCESLSILRVDALTPPKLEKNALEHFNSSCIVLVPKGRSPKYKGAVGWDQLKDRIFEPAFEANNINYEIESFVDKTVQVVKSSKAQGDIVINNQVEHCGQWFRVDTIGAEAFGDNKKLVSVVLPETITSIGDRAFKVPSNSQWKKVRIKATNPPKLGKDVFAGIMSSSAIVMVPKGRVDNYKGSTDWKQYADRIMDEYPRDFSEGGINYRILDFDAKEVEVGQNKDVSGAINIPSRVTNNGITYDVVGIGDFAFNSNTSITDVSLPDSIKTIGQLAFLFVTFTDLTLPSKLKEIGPSAFVGAKVETQKVTIPSSVNTIYGNPFHSCRVKEIIANNNAHFEAKDNVLFSKDGKIIAYPYLKADETYTIPNGVTTMGTSSFSNKNLTTLIIPATVKQLEDTVFQPCPKLKTLEVQGTTPPMVGENWFHGVPADCIIIVPKGCSAKYKAAEGWNWLKNRIFEESSLEFPVGKINYKVLSLAEKTVEVVKSPDAFGAVAIPQEVPYLEAKFTVVGIGERAFDQNTKVTSVTMPNTIKYVGPYAFQALKIPMTLPSSLETVGEYAFTSDVFNGLTFPSGMKEIGDFAFAYTTVKSETAYIPASVESVKRSPFFESSIKEITVDVNNGNYTSLRGVLFDKEVQKIIVYPALKTDETYTIPNGVTTIGKESFVKIQKMTKLVIPNTVTQLEDGALWTCPALKTLEVQGTTPPKVGENSLNGVPDNCVIIVPKECVETYKVADGWKKFKNRIVDESSTDSIITFIKKTIVDEIPAEFTTKDKIKYKVLLPDKTSVEVVANPKLRGDVIVPPKVEHEGVTFDVIGIGDNAFDTAKDVRVKSVKLPDTIKYIGKCAFQGQGIKLLLPSSLEEVRYYAFAGMSFDNLSLPSKLKVLDDEAFINVKVKSGKVNIPASVNAISGNPFYMAEISEIDVNRNNKNFLSKDGVLFSSDMKRIICYPRLKKGEVYTIPEGVETIGAKCFAYNNNLKRVVIPKSVKKIGNQAFYIIFNFTAIQLLCDTPPEVTDAFGGGPKDANSGMRAKVIIVPSNSAQAYRKNTVWKKFEIQEAR